MAINYKKELEKDIKENLKDLNLKVARVETQEDYSKSVILEMIKRK